MIDLGEEFHRTGKLPEGYYNLKDVFDEFREELKKELEKRSLYDNNKETTKNKIKSTSKRAKKL